jgi:predicted DNA-binding ribbon-helix-helix protein
VSISSINSSNLLNSVLSAAYSNSRDITSSSQSSGADSTSISSIGALMKAISQMSDDEQSSIKSFIDGLKSSVENGTFDAETAAEEAPDALKSYAEENGIDLTALVQNLADGTESSGVYGPPPPPPPDNNAGITETSGSSLDLSSIENLSDDEKSEVQSFMETLKSSLEDGTFNADTLAASAPDALQKLAEENGMSVSDLIQELADEAEKAPPPPQPPELYGSSGYQSSELSSAIASTYRTQA